MIVNLHVPWLALAMAPRVAPRKSIPSCSLTVTRSSQITARPRVKSLPASSQTRPCHSVTAVLPASCQLVALVTASFPGATVHAPMYPLCVWRVPPLCVPPLALSAGTPASPPLMTSDDYQMTSGALAGSAAFRCTFAATAATAGTEGVSVGVVGACRPRCGFVMAAAAGAWHASTHCESM